MNHIKFEWDNAYDIYAANALNEAMRTRPDIRDESEPDGYHFRSEGDLQPIMDVCARYGLAVTVVELNEGVTLSLIK